MKKHLKTVYSQQFQNILQLKRRGKITISKMEFERAKSAIFFPLYIDNVYIGYWIIEGSKPHEFDNIDTTILEVVKIILYQY